MFETRKWRNHYLNFQQTQRMHAKKYYICSCFYMHQLLSSQNNSASVTGRGGMWRRLRGGSAEISHPLNSETEGKRGVRTWVMSFLSSYATLTHARRMVITQTERQSKERCGAWWIPLDWRCTERQRICLEREGRLLFVLLLWLTSAADVITLINHVWKSEGGMRRTNDVIFSL